MNINRKHVFEGIAVLVVVVFLLFAWMKDADDGGEPLTSQDGINEEVVSTTKDEVPTGQSVPEEGEEDVPENVAVPSIVRPAAPGAESEYREFPVVDVVGDRFVPDTIVVRKGDIAHILFRAIDKDYDFTQPDLGLKSTLPEGVEKLIESWFGTEGKYTFYCESCGGPDKGPVGHIIVVDK